jgi:hypothetical protein
MLQPSWVSFNFIDDIVANDPFFVGLESFIDNFLIEVDGFYLAKKFSTDDIIIQLGFVIEGMKENELNKRYCCKRSFLRQLRYLK